MTQSQLADTGHIQQVLVSAYERGLQCSDPSHVLRLAAALDVKPRTLTAAAIIVNDDGTVYVPEAPIASRRQRNTKPRLERAT